jgi:pSer/pThr/pTyr-binding forkhead associated (FHA) protein
MEKTRVIVSNVHVVDIATKEETRILGEMVFGRAEVDKNFPSDSLISRRHFRFVPADDVVLIEDLGSTNRTKVNGKLLKPSTLYKLKSRDVIEFGQQKFQVFIDGKIVEHATKVGTLKEGHSNLPDRSMVFERFTTSEAAAAADSQGGLQGLEGLELHNDSESIALTGKDDLVLQNLVQKKNSAWYLQFSGSEFGPLTLKELKTLVQSKQFQGGELFAFTEGLADWLPIEKLSRYIEEPSAEFTATQRIAGGTPLAGTVTCVYRASKTGKVEGRLDSVTLSEITFTLKESFLVGTALFELEAKPDERSGVEPFKVTMKLDPSRSQKHTHSYTAVFVQATPRTKMTIERYLRSKT